MGSGAFQKLILRTHELMQLIKSHVRDVTLLFGMFAEKPNSTPMRLLGEHLAPLTAPNLFSLELAGN